MTASSSSIFLGMMIRTTLRMLQDLTGIDPKQIPLYDPQTLSLFSSTKALGLEPAQIGGCEVAVSAYLNSAPSLCGRY